MSIIENSVKKIITVPTRYELDWHFACALEVLQLKIDEGYKVEVYIPYYDESLGSVP